MFRAIPALFGISGQFADRPLKKAKPRSVSSSDKEKSKEGTAERPFYGAYLGLNNIVLQSGSKRGNFRLMQSK